MVAVPIVALAWLGLRLVDEGEQLAVHQVRQLLEDRLREVDGSIVRFMEARERELLRVAEGLPQSPRGIRGFLDGLPRGADVLVVHVDGRVLFPPAGDASRAERELLERTRSVWESGALPTEAKRARSEGRRARDHGWYGYYHGGGLSLLLWRSDGQRVVAVALPRIRLLSELVAYLPATTTGDDGQSRFRSTLVDASGAPVYQWGSYEPPAAEPPRAVVSLSAPLGAWSLRHYSPASELPTSLGGGLGFNLLAGLLAVALALVGLAVFLYRVRTREMRLAAQRVSFVNQVSHELKTPLTNIRLYAELLAGQLGYDDQGDDDDLDGDPVARHLRVITGESQRLSRLITNVLTFARGQQGRLEVKPRVGVVDAVVRDTRATFAPSLEQAGVRVVTELSAPAEVAVDGDAVGQILANLLSNIAKYAASGGEARIVTAQDGARTTVWISDKGPGIPAAQRDKVFEPFHRLDGTLTQGASGTGLGLDIARRLAVLHGGGLRLVDAEVGATFELTLHTPLVAGGEMFREDTP